MDFLYGRRGFVGAVVSSALLMGLLIGIQGDTSTVEAAPNNASFSIHEIDDTGDYFALLRWSPDSSDVAWRVLVKKNSNAYECWNHGTHEAGKSKVGASTLKSHNSQFLTAGPTWYIQLRTYADINSPGNNCDGSYSTFGEVTFGPITIESDGSATKPDFAPIGAITAVSEKHRHVELEWPRADDGRTVGYIVKREWKQTDGSVTPNKDVECVYANHASSVSTFRDMLVPAYVESSNYQKFDYRIFPVDGDHPYAVGRRDGTNPDHTVSCKTHDGSRLPSVGAPTVYSAELALSDDIRYDTSISAFLVQNLSQKVITITDITPMTPASKSSYTNPVLRVQWEVEGWDVGDRIAPAYRVRYRKVGTNPTDDGWIDVVSVNGMALEWPNMYSIDGSEFSSAWRSARFGTRRSKQDKHFAPGSDDVTLLEENERYQFRVGVCAVLPDQGTRTVRKLKKTDDGHEYVNVEVPVADLTGGENGTGTTLSNWCVGNDVKWSSVKTARVSYKE